MGQAASQPDAAASSGSGGRRPARRSPPRPRSMHMDRLVDWRRHGAGDGARDRRRGDRHADGQVDGLMDGDGDGDSARPAAPLHRTASRFRTLIGRRGALSRPPVHQRASYVSVAASDGDDDGTDYLPPRLPSIDLSATFDHDAFHAADEPDAASAPAPASTSRRSALRFNPLRPDRPFRNLTSSLRRRRSPPTPSGSGVRTGAEDQAAMLSRLLSVAAAATAATLMGDDPHALSEARSLTGSAGMGDLGAGGEDGSFDGFLRALHNGRIASALRQGASAGDGAGASGGGGGGADSAAREGPLNFFRMFRFGASGSPAPLSTGLGDPSEAGESTGEGRMVPIIIVGIRSINPSAGASAAADDLPPFIDALGNFPSPLPAAALGADGHDRIDSILRPPQNGTSFRHRRRASMGGLGLGRSRISDRLDDQRDHRSPDRRRDRPWSVASASSTVEPPRPAPGGVRASASPELSRISSHNTTPGHSRPASTGANGMNARRDAAAAAGGDVRPHSTLLRSATGSPLRAHTEEAEAETASLHSMHSDTNLLADDAGPSSGQQGHRRSDTTPNIHYPRFASGHPRRNGVVEPDHLPPLSRSSTSNATDASAANGSAGDARHSAANNDSRSWIIYVLGGSYPENHPILTTPSLFTENPTYEDMMLLSALLGPAKAPVASDEDVEAAGGICTIEADAAETARLVAVATESTAEGSAGERVPLEPDHRCLVCLSGFEVSDVCRKLTKCGHLFHKECIDQWLTQGRNSCPLCRGQGVNEKAPGAAAAPTGAPSSPAELDAGTAA